MDVYVKPNWASGVRENLEYLTTIFTTQNGNEQRSAERRYPRRTVTFQTMLHGDDLSAFRGYLHDRRHYLGYMPEPVEVLGTVSTFAPMGATSVQLVESVSVDPSDARIVISGFGRRTFATVAAHASGLLTLSTPLEATVQAGDEVRLCIPGRLPTNVSLTYQTDSIATCEITFNQEPGTPNRQFGTDAFEIFLGREVFNEQPNWAAPPSVEIISDYEISDFRRGVIKAFSPISFLSKITQFTFLGRNTAKMNRLIDFFNRQLGRCEEFWCPSWTSDLKLVEPITSGASSIVVRGKSIAATYSDSTVEKALALQLPGDVWVYCEIASMAVSGENTTITFVDPFTFDVDLGDVIGLYWLNVCRFASDTMTVQWITNEIAQAVLQIKTLEALPAEV